ncbi:MAG: hypothetical protein EYC62_06670 [Alphaproteobacteria bacterium]|nr:MAG: hypothetical protein EYC62_06670 [Alphaproteobacteria bacterium]
MTEQTPEFVAFAYDASDQKVISQVVEKNWPSAAVHSGGVAEAVALLNKGQTPHALLVDFSKSPDPEQDAKKLRELAPSTTLIGVGATNDVVLFRKLLAAGVADYLIKPLHVESLQQSIISAAHFSAGEEKKSGVADLIVIIGARGGVGASTLAVNAAWVLSEEYRYSVALADLDIHYGSSALALDIEPSPGLREALKNPSRIDSLFVTSALVKASERLYVMGSEEPIDDEIVPDPAAISLLLNEMRGRFQYVIVDLPRNLLPIFDAVIPEATKVFVVSDVSLSGIRDTVRLLSKIKQINKKSDIRLVANRLIDTPTGITVKDFERGTDSKIDFTIPDDIKIAVASNAGKTVSAMSCGAMSSPSKALLVIREICQTIAGKAAAAKKKQNMTSIMGLLGKKQ